MNENDQNRNKGNVTSNDNTNSPFENVSLDDHDVNLINSSDRNSDLNQNYGGSSDINFGSRETSYNKPTDAVAGVSNIDPHVKEEKTNDSINDKNDHRFNNLRNKTANIGSKFNNKNFFSSPDLDGEYPDDSLDNNYGQQSLSNLSNRFKTTIFNRSSKKDNSSFKKKNVVNNNSNNEENDNFSSDKSKNNEKSDRGNDKNDSDKASFFKDENDQSEKKQSILSTTVKKFILTHLPLIIGLIIILGVILLILFLVIFVVVLFGGDLGMSGNGSYGYDAATTDELDFMCNMASPFGDGSYTVTSFYGWRVHPISEDNRFHYGIDVVGSSDEAPIYAVADGVIQSINNDPSASLGINIVIRHNDTFTTQYGHMSSYVSSLQVGDSVVKGEQIGNQGNTGDSTGHHLHFIIYKDGETISSNPFFGYSDEGYESCINDQVNGASLSTSCNTDESADARYMGADGFEKICTTKKDDSSLVVSDDDHQRVIDIANREVDNWQRLSKSQKENRIKEYLNSAGGGYRVDQYCASFATYVLKEAEVFDKIGKLSTSYRYYPLTTVANFPMYMEGGTGQWHDLKNGSYMPKAGDLIIIDWSGGRSVADHVGIVEYVDENNIVHTIEGNRGNTLVGNYGSVGDVAKFTYSYNSSMIYGYFSW